MSSITEQISATSKSQLESQLDFLNSVLKNTVDVAGQVVALNLNLARNAAERSTTAARQLIEAKDPRAVLELARPLSAMEGLVAYQRELFSIAAQTQQAWLKTASDRLQETPAATLSLVAPVVTQISETAVNAAVAATNAAAEAAQAATAGAADAAAHAARAASDAAQAATSSAVEAARATTEEIDEAAEAATRAAPDMTEAAAQDTTEAVRDTAASAAGAAEATGDSVANVAEAVTDSAASSVKAAVTAAAERLTARTEETGETAPAPAPAPVLAASAPPFDTEPATHKAGRAKSASKPAPEVAAPADKPAAPAKSAPGKSRK